MMHDILSRGEYYSSFLTIKACFHNFSLFLKEQCAWLFRTKFFEKKFNLQLLYLPIVSQTFSSELPHAACLLKTLCNRDNACDIAACPDE